MGDDELVNLIERKLENAINGDGSPESDARQKVRDSPLHRFKHFPSDYGRMAFPFVPIPFPKVVVHNLLAGVTFRRTIPINRIL